MSEISSSHSRFSTVIKGEVLNLSLCLKPPSILFSFPPCSDATNMTIYFRVLGFNHCGLCFSVPQSWLGASCGFRRCSPSATESTHFTHSWLLLGIGDSPLLSQHIYSFVIIFTLAIWLLVSHVSEDLKKNPDCFLKLK